ncbi:MAG TPA: hypothetical protein VJL58_02285 [Pyrinomonadaceae bacterium]|nr:hypothetical protein [Pyrinomonadaceae bacterium]
MAEQKKMTIGQIVCFAIGNSAPTTPTVQTYSMPGMTGTYKFYWKQLKGATAADSGLTDFDQDLRYRGDKYGPPVNSNWNTMPEGTYLFH